MNELTTPSGQQTIMDLLNGKNARKRFTQILPKHMSPERMIRLCALSVNKTPQLMECTPMSLLGAFLSCAAFGFEPDTPLAHCHLIPFAKKRKEGNRWVTDKVEVNLVIGYRGYIDLARRSGTLSSLHADVVYENDTFEFQYGSNSGLKHVPAPKDRGEKIWAYCHASLTGGEEAFEVVPWETIMKTRDATEAYRSALRAKNNGKDYIYEKSPWVAHEDMMARKTAIRLLTKTLPMSIEYSNAAQLDQMSEVGRVDFEGIATDSGFDVVDGVAEHIVDEEEAPDQVDEVADAEPKEEKKKPAAKKKAAPKKKADKKATPAPDPDEVPPEGEPEEEPAGEATPEDATTFGSTDLDPEPEPTPEPSHEEEAGDMDAEIDALFD
jgi:recombination protein RecT